MSAFTNIVALPTGGVIGVTFTTALSGAILLERSPFPVLNYVTLYSGPPLNPRGDDQFFLDLGDQTPGPLPATTQYVYRLTDINNVIVSNPIMPVASVNIDRIDWTQIFIGMLQGAVNTVQLLPGMNQARVVQAMPLSGLLPMPFIVINNDLVQQEEVPIGQDVPTLGEGFVMPPYVNTWTQTGFDSKTYRITILSTNALERSFYKDLIIATFRANLYYIFQQLDNDISHSYQAVEYQTVTSELVPGFYGADIMLEFSGTRNVTMHTSYGLIEEIVATTITVNTFEDTGDTVSDTVIVPSAAYPEIDC